MFSIETFIADKEQLSAYIIGGAGTGKTTKLIEVVEELVKTKVNFKVCAYTHKAKDVLIGRLPILKDEYIYTLHALLKKRPTVNKVAKNIDALLVSKQYGDPEPLELLIIDEFSFIGEGDYMTIGDLQDKGIKVLYVGDPAQLDPVKSYQAVSPEGDYIEELIINHRSNTLLANLCNAQREFVDTTDILDIAMYSNGDSITLIDDYEIFLNTIQGVKNNSEYTYKALAFTNSRVQKLNMEIHNKELEYGDILECSTLRKQVVFNTRIAKSQIDRLVVPTKDGYIDRTTKYNPVGQLSKIKDIMYFDTNIGVIPCIFGSSRSQIVRGNIARALTNKNANNMASKKEYAKYKTVEDYVSTVDYPYATTIHKSQGSEYDVVALHYDDMLDKCVNRKAFNRLLYVALSRAKIRLLIYKEIR